MNDACEQYRKRIADLLAGELSPEGAADVEAHLRDCSGCRLYQRDLLEDDRLLTDFVLSADADVSRLEGAVMESIYHQDQETPAAGTRLETRRATALFRTPLVKVAAALVVLAGIIAVASLVNRGGDSGVVWAEMIRQVEEAKDFICRVSQRTTGGPDIEMVRYQSAKYGIRIDMYREGRMVANQYLEKDSDELIVLVHRDKTWTRVRLGEQQLEAMRSGQSAQEIVEYFKQDGYEEIGRKKIDGVMASGIEVHNPEGLKGLVDEMTLRVWVDDRTNWPVKFEMEGSASQGDYRVHQVLDRFQWNPALAKEDFEYDIPRDYKMIGDIEAPRADESSAMEGLSAYRDLTGGSYPSSLTYTTAIAEATDGIDRRRDGQFDKETFEDLMKIQNTCAFFTELERQDRDPAWYGEEVDARDYDRVLLRWRLEDGRYRVIYGDLRTETVSREELAELEGD